jgi:hypothetical protein
MASSPRNRVNSSQRSGATTSFRIVTAIQPTAWIVSELQPAHEPYCHSSLPRSDGIAVPSGFSPSYMKFGTGSWRDVIVARRTRKSSASFEALAMVSLRELAGHLLRKTLHRRRLQNRPYLFAGSRPIDESPLGQSRQVAGGSEEPLRTLHSFLLGNLVLHQEQAGGKEPAGAPAAAEGNRKNGGRGRRPRPSGLQQPDDAQDPGPTKDRPRTRSTTTRIPTTTRSHRSPRRGHRPRSQCIKSGSSRQSNLLSVLHSEADLGGPRIHKGSISRN